MNNFANYSTSRFKLKLAVAGFVVLAAQMMFGQTQSTARASQMQATETSSSDDSAVVQITVPSDVQLDTLSATLNGKDVTSLFTRETCKTGICEQATLTTQDGLHKSKNALSVVAKRNDGSLVSVRDRFDAQQPTAIPVGPSGQLMAHANAAVSGAPTLSSFLPPSIAFNTLQTGGYTVNKPWFQIGSQNTYPTNPSGFNCQSPSLYSVIVLDRQTLVEKTSSPESSPQCITDGKALKTYLATLTSDDLVIVGSNQGVNSDAGVAPDQLDTSAIGGKAYNCISYPNCKTLPSTTVQSQDVPQGYMAIGAGGAASGSAYENYYVPNPVWWVTVPFATGMLVEDVNGNYNFQPSGTVEYSVNPNDPNNSNVSTIEVDTIPGDPYYQKGILHKVYRPPVSPSQGGFWLLTLQRSTLFSVPLDIPPPPPTAAYQDACPQSTTSSDGKTAYFNNCGQFYNTNVSSSSDSAAQYLSLSADLQDLDTNTLAFLVTVGTAGYQDTNGIKLIPTGLATAFSELGGTPETLTSLNQAGSTYSFVGCQGCGNSLGGHTIISTSLQPQQGQNGYIHGLLQRNLNGIFWPTQASLDQPDATTGAPTTDFTMQEVAGLQPVDWPELSTTAKLSVNGATADTTAGQNAAYYYIGYQLITQYYILGAQGSHIDDIHYYFTGGNNTFLDYHTFDPAKLTFPGAANTCYQWTDPVAGRGALSCFTQNDFNAVVAQMHNEIVYLTNVLQFMVTGSTNMKDLVASGNGSAALALINAAASVKASTLQPPPATPVKSNVSNILNLVGNVVSVAASIATAGASTSVTDAAKAAVAIIGPTAGVITGSFGIASSVTGGLHTGGGPAPIPSPDYYFETTIGDLSSNTLQQTFTAGFDTGLDTILGDWNKLSIIGPKITDTSQAGFQAATQAAQVVSTIQIGQASQRSFYMALLPINYSIQHYTYWFGRFGATNNPDMGARTDDNPGYCNTWYYSGNPPSNINQVSKSYFSYADGGPTRFSFLWGSRDAVTIPAPVDWSIIAAQTANNPGKSNQTFQLLDSQVAFTLFDPSQLNLPMDAFLDKGGPMASVWADSGSSGFDNFPANQTCSFYVAQNYGNKNSPDSNLGAPSSNAVAVTLSIPATGVLGDNVTLKATALATGSNPVTAGTISFQDGDVELGQAALDGTGTATLTLNTLAIGSHSIVAYFLATTQYTATQSTASTLIIYSSDPDLVLVPAAAGLTVTNGGSSSPLSLQVTSKWGLAGPVNFTCSGLPAGMTCAFNPGQVTLTAGGSASTVLTVSSVTQSAAITGSLGIFSAFLLPLPLLWLRRKRVALRSLCLMMTLGTLASLGFLTGCGGSHTTPTQQPATHTILVTATSGSVSRSVPITITVQ